MNPISILSGINYNKALTNLEEKMDDSMEIIEDKAYDINDILGNIVEFTHNKISDCCDIIS